ncbi:unnamed protein product, partial [marine sediment metagenome]
GRVLAPRILDPQSFDPSGMLGFRTTESDAERLTRDAVATYLRFGASLESRSAGQTWLQRQRIQLGDDRWADLARILAALPMAMVGTVPELVGSGGKGRGRRAGRTGAGETVALDLRRLRQLRPLLCVYGLFQSKKSMVILSVASWLALHRINVLVVLRPSSADRAQLLQRALDRDRADGEWMGSRAERHAFRPGQFRTSASVTETELRAGGMVVIEIAHNGNMRKLREKLGASEFGLIVDEADANRCAN